MKKKNRLILVYSEENKFTFTASCVLASVRGVLGRFCDLLLSFIKRERNKAGDSKPLKPEMITPP